MRSALTEIFMAEWTQNFFLIYARVASHSLIKFQYPDQLHGPGFLGERRRLFRIHQGDVILLAEIHSFYFLESSGILEVNGFLALRRAQELTWAP